MPTLNLLSWEENYSVHVKQIDEQHKGLLKIMNNLIREISGIPDKERVSQFIAQIVKYKSEHFNTEEGYFKQFQYEGTEEHILAHREFGIKLKSIQDKFSDDAIGFAFALVDFLEDWLVDHMLNMDQKYIKCFTEHGLT
jgi:hemerythrin